MPSEVKIAAEPRTEFGKGAARRIRRAAKVPAVLYGHGTDPVHITLPGHDLMLALKTANALLSIEYDGTSQLALPKQVQRDPIKGFIEHADLLIVRSGEKVTVDVAVVLVGDAAPDTLVNLENNSVALEAEATHIPSSVEVDITGLQAGTQIHARDLVVPEGSTLAVDDDLLIVNITAQQSQEALEAELADAEADLGIEHDEPEAATDEAGGATRRLPTRPAPTPRADLRDVLGRLLRRKSEETMPSDVWVIAGLGNPGPTYAGTRHNVGYLVVDELLDRSTGTLRPHKSGRALAAEVRLNGPGGQRAVLMRGRGLHERVRRPGLGRAGLLQGRRRSGSS